MDFYIYKYLAGADTVKEADHLRQQLCQLLAEAGMTLWKWRTNSTELRGRIPSDLLESLPLLLPTPCHAPKAF